jgi:CRISPR-associated protein Csd2
MSNPIQNKIDFAVVIGVHRANPNGDPLNGNRPRQTADRLGEISDVCLKRKIRNRLLAMGEEIFVQSDDNRAPSDEFRSLKARFDASGIKKDQVREKGPEKWFDVRSFGQLFAFKDEKKKGSKGKANESTDDGNPDNGWSEDGTGAVSIGIRGPVTIQGAYSLDPIVPESIQITKSVNLEPDPKHPDPDRKGGDTMGMKHRVASAVYVAYGAITPQLASKTGFSDEDAEKIKLALQSLFEGDASAARPEGSMEVLHVVWCKHSSPCGQYSSARVHRAIAAALDKNKDGTFDADAVKKALPDLAIEFLPALEGEALAKLPKRNDN